MLDLTDALHDPIALAPNRVHRFYRGGLLLDELRGDREPRDDDLPEDWVGSATRAWTPPATPPTPLGLSEVMVGEERLTLESVLDRAPEALIGREMLERAGPTLGVLVKLLDAGERLPVHCHPGRDAAARLLGSPFGKTEAWLILGTRDGAQPRIWAGFHDPVEPATLRHWIDDQDTDALLGALIEHPVEAGDAFLIPAGTPHAIGAGVFLLELQEPTDFSVVAEIRGFPITEADASLGLGWDTAIDFFTTDAAAGFAQAAEPGSRLLGPDADPYFRARRLDVTRDTGLDLEPTFAIGVVVAGSGQVHGRTTSLRLNRGSTFALPALAMKDATITSDGIEIILCLPPDPAALPASFTLVARPRR
jgi:mannose-6-phosphate isomerase